MNAAKMSHTVAFAKPDSAQPSAALAALKVGLASSVDACGGRSETWNCDPKQLVVQLQAKGSGSVAQGLQVGVACPFRMLGGRATVNDWATKEFWSGAAQVVDEGRVLVFLGSLEAELKGLS